MDIRVQLAAHFNIDPARQVIGAIQFPEKVTITLVVGEQIEPQKVDFDLAFSPSQKAQIETKLTPLILEAGRTARPLAATDASTAPEQASGPSPATSSGDEESLSLFG